MAQPGTILSGSFFILYLGCCVPSCENLSIRYGMAKLHRAEIPLFYSLGGVTYPYRYSPAFNNLGSDLKQRGFQSTPEGIQYSSPKINHQCY